MRFTARRIQAHDLTDDLARSAFRGGGALTAIVSAFALIFSAFSLYETVLKQAQLRIYVPPVVHYARNPSGQIEMFAVPMTIANHGARDAAVLSISLDVSRAGTGTAETKTFFSAYFVEADFFTKGKGFNRQTRRIERNPRPKQPFAPVSVAGRASYTGTVLFYVKGKTFPLAVADKGDYALTLRLRTASDDASGAEKLLHREAEPIALKVTLSQFSTQQLSAGAILQMRDSAWSAQNK